MSSVTNGMRAGAARLGISLDEYCAHRDAGEKWCSWHRAWHAVSAFDPMRSASSSHGLQPSCRESWQDRQDRLRLSQRVGWN